MSTITLRPIDDLNSSNVEGDSGESSNFYALVDEEELDVGDYITEAGTVSPMRCEFDWTETSFSGETINSVTFYFYVDADGVDIDLSRNSGGTRDTMSTGQTPAGWVSKEYTTSPQTSLAWTPSEINGLDYGFYIASDGIGKPTRNMYMVYAVVDYELGGNPGYYYAQQ